MRQLLITALAFMVISSGCNSNKDKITVKDDNGGTATIDVSDAKDAAKKMEENADKAAELKKLTPL